IVSPCPSGTHGSASGREASGGRPPRSTATAAPAPAPCGGASRLYGCDLSDDVAGWAPLCADPPCSVGFLDAARNGPGYSRRFPGSPHHVPVPFGCGTSGEVPMVRQLSSGLVVVALVTAAAAVSGCQEEETME